MFWSNHVDLWKANQWMRFYTVQQQAPRQNTKDCISTLTLIENWMLIVWSDSNTPLSKGGFCSLFTGAADSFSLFLFGNSTLRAASCGRWQNTRESLGCDMKNLWAVLLWIRLKTIGEIFLLLLLLPSSLLSSSLQLSDCHTGAGNISCNTRGGLNQFASSFYLKICWPRILTFISNANYIVAVHSSPLHYRQH